MRGTSFPTTGFRQVGCHVPRDDRELRPGQRNEPQRFGPIATRLGQVGAVDDPFQTELSNPLGDPLLEVGRLPGKHDRRDVA